MKYILTSCLPLLFVLCLTSCKEREEALAHIETEATKEEILSIVGQPDEQETITKHEEAIWGPEEEFWHKIPLGAKLERWIYATDEGRYSLYFRGNEDWLAYKIFAPRGVVYESGG